MEGKWMEAVPAEERCKNKCFMESRGRHERGRGHVVFCRDGSSYPRGGARNRGRRAPPSALIADFDVAVSRTYIHVSAGLPYSNSGTF